MAGEVQLKLQTTLDLAYLQTQLASLKSVVNKVPFSIVPKLDLKQVQKDLKNLQKEIRVQVNDSQIDALSRKVESAAAKLKELGAAQNKVVIGVTAQAAVTKQDVRKARTGVYRQIVSEGGKILLPVGLAPISQTAADRFKADLLKKIGTISVNVKANIQGGFASSPLGAAGLEQYMRTQGLSGGNVRGATQMARGALFEKTITEASSRDLKRMLQVADVPGRSGLTTKSAMQDALRQLSQDAQEKILGNLQMRMRDTPQGPKRGFLDQVARAVFWMAGVDPEYLRQQAAQRRALPAINFEATVPQRQVSIGPSTTGRALPFGVSAGALPGTAFGGQKRLIGDILDPELKEILRGAANVFVDSVRSQLNAAVRSVSVRDLGISIRGALPSGASSPSRLMLPAAGGSGGYFGGGRRPGGGYVPPEGFPSEGPIAQSSSLARKLPAGYLEMGRFASQLREADKYLKQSRIPLAGAIEELGSEFGEATKQVLLYGTAYKGLAFFTSLPQQAFDAARALQTFNNQLNAITGSAQAAGRASQFVSSVVDQFNIPLDSARQGFTRLYASMQPAGIDPQIIEGLFTGISKASATLGLSADQVDRVTYAFSQMASKGQIMSEEVSGQLGDVIPGALSIMSQAAGMSMSEFKVAMEKGQLSGKALEQVFANLEIVLDQRFGKGAQGAANTLQGMVNSMQTAMTRLYESFEPVVGAVASAFGPQIIGLINDGAAAITAFGSAMSGSNGPANMLSQNGKVIYGVIQQVVEIFKAAGQIIQNIAPTFAALGKVVLTIAEYLAKFINTPVGGFLADLALKTGLVLAAMQALSGLLKLQLIASIIDFTRITIASTTGLAGFTKATWTAVAATKAFRLALIGLGAGAVLLAIEALISKLSEAAGKMERLRKSTIDAIGSIRQMDQAQARQTLNQTQADLKAISNIEKNTRIRENLVEISEDQYKALERARVPGLTRTVAGRGSSGRINIPAFDPVFAEAARQNLQRQQAEADKRLKDLQQESIQAQIQKVELAPGKTKDASKAANKAKQEASEFNRLLQDELKAQTDLGMIGKDQLTQIEARVALAKDLLRLRLQDIRATEIGRIRDQKVANEILLYKLTVEKANEEWANTIEKFKNIDSQIVEIRSKLQSIGTTEKNPIQEALEKIEKQAKDDIDLIDKLLKDTKELGGLRPETKTRRESLGALRAEIAGESPEQKRVRASKEVTASVVKDLKEQRAELQNAGSELTTLDKLTIQFGNTWKELAPEVKIEISNLAAQIDALQPFAKWAEGARQLRREMNELINLNNLTMGGARAIGDAFGTAFRDVVSGATTAQQALSNMMQSIANYFLDMAGKIIAQQITMIVYGTIMKALGIGIPGGGGSSLVKGMDVPVSQMPAGMAFANGGIAQGGFVPFKAFANGGVVNGPTLGLVGEGKYNEAVVPLPDGRSIPVTMRGEQPSSRELLSNQGSSNKASSPVLNMSFQTTTINGVEYVSKDQLEAAMMETRKLAARDGANRGAALAIDRLQHSPNTRRRIGI